MGWLLGRGGLKASVLVLAGLLGLSASGAEGATASRSSSFAYDATTGLLTQESVEPGTASLRLDTTYEYDGYGNRSSVTVSGQAYGWRKTALNYSGDGRWLLWTSNPLQQEVHQTYDARFGAVATATDANGLTASVQYDGFGRKVLAIAADGTRVKYQYFYCAGTANGTYACPGYARYVVVTTPLAADGTTPIGPWTKVYSDQLNRPVRKEAQGFDGSGTSKVATVDIQYDNRGRLVKQSEPYYPGDTVYWTTGTFDVLDRPLTVTAPDGSVTTTAYDGLTTTVTNAKGQVQAVTKNSQGAVASSRDALGSVTRFEYDPFGNLVQTIDPAGNRVKAAYDVRGRQVQLNDPDLGVRNYTYDEAGQLTQSVDAKGQTTSYTYDFLGRVTKRTEADLTTTYTYDTAAHGIGKPATVATGAGYSQSFTYDTLGRPSGTVETLESGVSGSGGQTYDAYGRVLTATAPGGQTLAYTYTALGYLYEVRNNATGGVIWRAEAMDAAGTVTQERYGNNIVTRRTVDPTRGAVTAIASRTSTATSDNIQNLSYSYDQLLNMTQRWDGIQGTTENFGFDGLNRLTGSQVTGYAAQTVAYDILGNITSKSDAGTYTYGAGGGVRPHAVTHIQGLPNTLTPSGGNLLGSLLGNLLGALLGNPQPGAADFTYDANGNMTWGDGRTTVWTSFDMPSSIKRGSVTLGFAYGAGHQRIRQVRSDATIHYFGAGQVERVKTSAGAISWTTYVSVGGRLVGQLTRQDGAAANTAVTRYFHTDHLGSIETVTDELGAVVERLDFDAWGKRRYGNGSADPNGQITSQFRRGFTGHEQLDTVGLVHMNGRVYDPLIGRFASADPVVQAPTNLQNYNRYSYAFNNPLSYTDPTGYRSFWKKLGHFFSNVGKVFGDFFKFVFSRQGLAILVGAALFFTLGPIMGAVIESELWAGVAAAAISGAASGAISTGTLKGAIIGAVSAAVTYGIGHGIFEGSGWYDHLGKDGQFAVRTLSHGVFQGSISEVSGGDFRDGFVGAAFSYVVGATVLDNLIPINDNSSPGEILARGAAEAMAGGTAAVIGGGKFANGAESAAFVYLYNAAAGRAVGQFVGGTVAGIAGAETGPGDTIIIAAGRWVGGLIGSAIEDWIFPSSAPFLPDDPYSPESVSRRQSDLRRQLGAPNEDPETPIPDQGPGRDMGGHSARGATPHETGERNVNSNEEHSRRPKGASYYR